MADQKNDVFEELWKIALSKPLDCLRWEDGKLELRQDIPLESIPGIAGVERSAAGVKVKFYDKLKAIELILTHQYGNKGTANNGLLEAIVAASADAVDIGDIKELVENDDNGVFIAEGS